MSKEVIEGAKGRTDLSRIIGETLPLRRQGGEWVALCPFHGERTPSFTIYPDHFHCYGCGVHGDAIDWLKRAHGMSFFEAVAYLAGDGSGSIIEHREPRRRHTAATLENQEKARRIWSEATDPHGTPVETYLRTRGVELPDEPVLRFHPHCPCERHHLPAMVALMTDPLTSEPRGVHRTFLRADGSGKAGIDRPKRMLGTAGVVRLYEPEGPGLGIAEGIETALNVAQGIAWGPVWAAASAGAIRHFPPLPLCTLNIFADHDDAGVPSAEDCAERWANEGLEVFIHTPPPGEDWADAARRIEL